MKAATSFLRFVRTAADVLLSKMRDIAQKFVISVIVALSVSTDASAHATSFSNTCRAVRVGNEIVIIVFTFSPQGRVPDELGRAAIPYLEVWTDGESERMLWSIEGKTDGDAEAVSQVIYGYVPKDYVQRYPRRGRPAALTNGRYRIECAGRARFKISSTGVENED